MWYRSWGQVNHGFGPVTDPRRRPGTGVDGDPPPLPIAFETGHGATQMFTNKYIFVVATNVLTLLTFR